ncbi:cupin domain-containing protein [soil metagenome]
MKPALAARFDLEPHPEGGWYTRTWTSPTTVEIEGRTRPLATLILFLLPVGEFSAWHTVTSAETWIWNGYGPVALQLGGSGEAPVAGDVLAVDADHPQAFVPAGQWQRTLPGEADALVSCLVSPGFDFADFTLADD